MDVILANKIFLVFNAAFLIGLMFLTESYYSIRAQSKKTLEQADVHLKRCIENEKEWEKIIAGAKETHALLVEHNKTMASLIESKKKYSNHD